MLSLEESLKILKETNALLEGHFILSSGLHSPQYVQCAKLMSKPEKAHKICASLSEKIINEYKDFDLVLSPAIGGIVIGYEIGRLLNKETIFSERVDGKFVLRRDFLIKKNQRVIVVEDVITTGKSSLECSKIVDNLGGIIIGYACIIDRSNEQTLIKKKIISQVKLNIPTYKEEDLPKDLSSIKAIKPGSRNL